MRESKARLSALVDLAARGEEILITVRGKPKARLCPLPKVEPKTRRNGVAWESVLRETRAAYSTGEIDSSAAIIDDIRGDRA